MATWAAFERAVPELASAGRRLLVGADGVAIGFLATVAPSGTPHLAPVCPIFCADHLYLSAGIRTPKVRDLRAGSPFTLHAFLGENDEEFQVSGIERALRVYWERVGQPDTKAVRRRWSERARSRST